MTEIEKYFIEGAVAAILPVLAFFWGKKALNKKEKVAIIRDVSLLHRSDDVLRFERGSYDIAEKMHNVNILTLILFNAVGVEGMQQPLGRRIEISDDMEIKILHLFSLFTKGTKENKQLLRDINKQENYKISQFFEESLVYLDEYYRASGILEAADYDNGRFETALKHKLSESNYAVIDPYLDFLQDMHQKLKISDMLNDESADDWRLHPQEVDNYRSRNHYR